MFAEPPMDTDAEEAREAAQPSSRDETRVSRRTCNRWGAALLLGFALAGVGGGLAYLRWKPTYEASACLYIAKSRPYIVFEPKDEGNSPIFLQTQIALLHHPVVLQAVLASSEVAHLPEVAAQSEPVKWLSERMSVKPHGDSELYDVTFAASDPQTAAIVVNAILDEYFHLHGQEDAGRAEQVIRILEQERDNRARELTLLRNSVRELAKEATGKDPFAGTADSTVAVEHPLADLQNQLATAEIEQEVLKARLKACQETASQTISISQALIDNKIEVHPQVMRCKEEIIDLQIQLQTLASHSSGGEKDPAHLQITQQLHKKEKLLAQLRQDLQKPMQQELEVVAAAKRDEQITALQTDLESRRITAEILRERYDRQRKEVKPTSGDTLQLRFKQGELARAEKIYDGISERIALLRTERGAPERVSLIQSAVPPTAPIEVFPYRDIGLAALAGFSLPFLGSLLFSAIAWIISACFPVVKRQRP